MRRVGNSLICMVIIDLSSNKGSGGFYIIFEEFI
jgi:hypothetical protein